MRRTAAVAGVGFVVAGAIAWRLWSASPSPPAHETAPPPATPQTSEHASAPPIAPAAPLASAPEPDGIVARFRFVAADTHEPIAGLAVVLDQDVAQWPDIARICLRPGAAPSSPRTIRATSGVDGLASFEGAHAGGARLVVDDDYRFVSLDAGVTIDATSTAPRDVAVERGAMLRGRVVAESGAPIAGAKITELDRYVNDERRDASWKASFTMAPQNPSIATSDTSGAFVLRHAAAQQHGWVWVSHPEFVEDKSDPFDIVAGTEVSVPDVVLRTGGGIVVHVVDASGSAVVGAHVEVRDGGDFLDGPRLVGEGTTDASGVVRVRSLRPDEYSVHVSTDDHPTAALEGVPVEKDATAERTLTLEDGTFLEGVVVDEAGRAVAGAKGFAWGQPTSREFVTSEDGRFRVVGLEAKPTGLTVQSSEHLPTKTEERVPDGTEWRVVLRAGGRISGRVQGGDGSSATEFELMLLDPEGEARAFRGTDSRSLQVRSVDGGFSVPALEDGSYSVLVRRGREAVLSGAFAIVGSSAIDDVVLVLAPTLTVRGRVLAAATRAPIAKSSVIWTPLPAAATAGRMGFERIGGREPASTDEDGSYVLEGVPRQALAIDAKGPFRYAARVEPIPPGRADGGVIVDLLVTGGASVAGVVRDASGRPVGSARVDLVERFSRLASAQTGPDGAYWMGGLPAGRYVVGIAKENAGEISGEEGLRDGVPVTLHDGDALKQDLGPATQTGCRLHGKVVVDGQPAARARVTLVDAATAWPLATRDSPRERLALADDAGEFEIPSVPAGSWVLSAELRDGSVVAPVTIASEREATVDLIAPRGSIDVRVVDAASREPLSFIEVAVRRVGARDVRGRVTAWAPGLWTRMTEKDGSAKLRYLPTGAFVMRVSPPSFLEQLGPLTYTTERLDVEIGESATSSIEVALARGAVLEGRVTDASGAPIERAAVLLFDDLGRAAGGLFAKGSDTDGKYQVGGLTPGTYEARVLAEGRALLRRGGVRIAEAEGSRADFVLVAGGSVAITVVDAGGAAVAHAALDWADESGHRASDDLLLYGPLEVNSEGQVRWESDAAGRFARDHVSPGRFTFVATEGTRTGSVAVDVREGEATSGRIELK